MKIWVLKGYLIGQPLQVKHMLCPVMVLVLQLRRAVAFPPTCWFISAALKLEIVDLLKLSLLIDFFMMLVFYVFVFYLLSLIDKSKICQLQRDCI